MEFERGFPGIEAPRLRLPLRLHNAGYARWEAGHSFAREHSTIFAVELIVAGDCELLQDGHPEVITAGGVYLLRQGASHTYRTGPSGFLLKRLASMAGPALETLLDHMGLNKLDALRPGRPAVIEGLFRKAVALFRNRPEGLEIESSQLAYRLLAELAPSDVPALPEPLQRALAWMERHLAGSLDTHSLARAAGLSPGHLGRLFQRHLGSSPLRLHLDRKMAWAAELLRETTQPVKAIAAAVGCPDALYFSTQFKRRYGKSPRAWRQALQRGDDKRIGKL